MKAYRFHIIRDDGSREIWRVVAASVSAAVALFWLENGATYEHGAWALYSGGKRVRRSEAYAVAAGDQIRRRSDA